MDTHTIQLGSAGFMRHAWVWRFISIVTLVLTSPSGGNAQVTTTITSSGLSTQINQVANGATITGGTRPGGGPNLFHSFGNFAVGTGDLANFLNDTGLPTSNILGRVTGGNISTIDGTIQTTGFGNANLFLMNPSGIVLGPGASLNVGGSVSFTTAQYFRLFDGVNSANFYANSANDGLANSILAINVSAFEFLSASPGGYGFLTAPDPNVAIAVQGSNLAVPSGQSISLVGGKVVIEAGAQLTAPNGNINLAGTTSPGEFDATTLSSLPNRDGASFSSFGTIHMAPSSSVDVHGTSTVFIKDGQLVLSLNDTTLRASENDAPPDTVELTPTSSIVTSTSGANPGADLQITAGTVRMDSTSVQTLNSGDLAGGNISINATTVDLTNGTSLSSFTGLDFSTGNIVGSGGGGNVIVQGLDGQAGSHTGSFILSNSSFISTTTVGPGKGGDVRLNASALTIDNVSSITTVTTGGDNGVGGSGVGGDLVLNAEIVSLSSGASIVSQAAQGGGHGGNVIIQGLQGAGSPSESISLLAASSLSSETFGSSNGGGIAIISKTLIMDGGNTVINSSVSDVGRGGDVVVSVQLASLSGGATITGKTINSQGPTLTVQGLQGADDKADSVILSGSGTGIISDSVGGTIRAGDVAVRAKSVSLAEGAVIQAATTVTTAAGGNVMIDADTVNLSGASRISSQASDSDAGQITITANALTLNNSAISTNTISTGRAGDVRLSTGTLHLLNQATINSSTNASGQAGDITITGNTVTLDSGGAISSASTGTEPTVNFDGTTAPPGRAGTITITASGNVTSNAGTITTSAEANRGGDISITASNIQFSNGTLINANSNGPLTVIQLMLDGNGQLVEQVVGDGNAGNIRIESGSTVLIEQSSVTTEASQASGGQITINAPDMIRFIDSPISTSVAGAAGDSNGGNISIDPDFVVLKGSQILAQAFAGSGGAIDVTAGLFLADPASVVDASSTLGVSGTVQINAPINNLSSVVARLPESLLAVQALLRASCAAKLAQGSTSSFVERGRDGIPAGPDGLLASPYLPPTADYATQRPATASSRFSGIQLRRLFRQEMPSSVTLISDQGGCVS